MKYILKTNNTNRYIIVIAKINIDKKRIVLGYFKNKLDAAKAYDTYVLENNLEHTINGVIDVSK